MVFDFLVQVFESLVYVIILDGLEPPCVVVAVWSLDISCVDYGRPYEQDGKQYLSHRIVEFKVVS